MTQVELKENPPTLPSGVHNDSDLKNQALFNQNRYEAIEKLVFTLKQFEAFKDAQQGQALEALRQKSIHIAEHKLLPELKNPNLLPLIVSLVGGTNTGKSTFFNALVGMILSEARISAGATKHPLIYAHEAYRNQICSNEVFSNLEISQLQSPGQLLVPNDRPQLYYQLHQREELRDFALIDCPDFDSVAKENQLSARRVVEQSDLCIFLTTPQKYKDRLLVNELAWLLEQKKEVFVLFNLTDDQMLYRTMLEDLKQQLPSHHHLFYGSYLPVLKDSQPERILETQVWAAVHDFLAHKSKDVIKNEQIQAGIELLLSTTRQIIAEYQKQTDLKDHLMQALETHLDEATQRYERDFQLKFPEITVALDQQMAQLELYHLFKPSEEKQAPSKVKVALDQLQSKSQAPNVVPILYHFFGLAGPKIRKYFIKQFDLGDLPSNWDQFCEERDQRDLLSIRSCAQFMRTGIEQVLRVNVSKSAMAQLLIEKYFSADQLQKIDQSITDEFKKLHSTSVSVSKEVLQKAEQFNQKQGSFLKRFATWIANLLKFTMALLFAYYSDGIGFWDLLIFGPMGFLVTAYGISWILYANLSRQTTAFRRQRTTIATTIFDQLQVKPIKAMVDQMANREQLNTLIQQADLLNQLAK